MKPKHRVFCINIQRAKLLFETEKKAEAYIKFNAQEIRDQRGYAPLRSYFCDACYGWHVTSKMEKPRQTQSVIEHVLEWEEQQRNVKRTQRVVQKHLRKKLDLLLNEIETEMDTIRGFFKVNDFEKCQTAVLEQLEKLKNARQIDGRRQRKRRIQHFLDFYVQALKSSI